MTRNKKTYQDKRRRKQTKPSAAPSRSPSPATPSPSPASSPPPSRFTPTPTVAALALCALIVAAFFPALSAGFVWDDFVFTQSEAVRRWHGLAQIWFEPSAVSRGEAHYWPLLYSLFWLEHKLWGYAPLGYHLVNLTLHAAVTLLLWRLLSRFKIPGAFIAAAVFAVHPVHAESVAWVIGRKDVLAALFFLSAAWFYINFVEQHRHRDFGFALALFIAGMLSKSTVVTLPAALLVWHWWRRGNITVADVKRIAPFIVVGVAIAVADWLYYAGREIISLDYSLAERVLIAAQALWFYVRKLVLPTGSMVIYPHFTVGVGDVVAWLYLLAAVVFALALWFARHRLGRGPLAGVLFFALTLSPVLGLVDYGYMQFAFVADRYQYLAAAGVIVVAAAAATRFIQTLPAATVVASVATAAILVPLTALTWQQSSIYKSQAVFFAHIIAHNPAARGAHHNLGIGLKEESRYLEALAAYRVAEKENPDSSKIAAEMGVILVRLGREQEAEVAYRRALQLKPRNKVALHDWGVLLTRKKNYAEALALYQRALAVDADYAKAHASMGVALFNLGRREDAIQSLDRALRLDASQDEARANRELFLQLMQTDAGG